MFTKSDFILKSQGTCIDYTLENQSMLTSKLYNLVRISKRRCMSLLSISPHKLVTPLSIIDTTMAFPHVSQPKLFSRLGSCAPSKTVYCQCGVQYQRIMSKVISLFSPSFVLKSHELQRRLPKSLFNDILHYSDACTELRLTLSVSSCLF